MKHINTYVDTIKKEDGVLYAIYGSPAESLCGTQLKQFRDKYGIVKGVSDKEFFTNSFHCYVGEDITPFEKQDKEIELFKMVSGGHINYVRVNPDNKKALKSLILRGLEKGFYQGVNFNECVCEDCGHNFTGEHGENHHCTQHAALGILQSARQAREEDQGTRHRIGRSVQAFLALKQMAAFKKVNCLEWADTVEKLVGASAQVGVRRVARSD